LNRLVPNEVHYNMEKILECFYQKP